MYNKFGIDTGCDALYFIYKQKLCFHLNVEIIPALMAFVEFRMMLNFCATFVLRSDNTNLLSKCWFQESPLTTERCDGRHLMFRLCSTSHSYQSQRERERERPVTSHSADITPLQPHTARLHESVPPSPLFSRHLYLSLPGPDAEDAAVPAPAQAGDGRRPMARQSRLWTRVQRSRQSPSL